MRLKLCAVTLLCATPVACATPAPPRIVDSSCTAFRPISYAQMPKRADGTRETDDQENKADSDETVEEIDVHNAKWDRLCAATPASVKPN